MHNTVASNLTNDTVFYFSAAGVIQHCQLSELKKHFALDHSVYYDRDPHPKIVAVLNTQKEMEKYVAFLMKDSTWLVPVNDATLTALRNDTLSLEQFDARGTTSFTGNASSPIDGRQEIIKSWVLSRCKRPAEDFTDEDVLAYQAAITTNHPARQTASEEHTPHTTLAVNTRNEGMSETELAEIRSKRAKQKSDYEQTKAQLDALLLADEIKPPEIIPFARRASAVSFFQASSPIMVTGSSKKSIHTASSTSSLVPRIPRNKKALFAVVCDVVTASIRMKESGKTALRQISLELNDDDPLSIRQVSSRATDTPHSPGLCFPPEYCQDQQGERVVPHDPTDHDVQKMQALLLKHGIALTDSLIEAIKQNHFLHTIPNTITALTSPTDFAITLSDIPESGLSALFDGRNFANLHCILIWLQEKEIEITTARILSLTQSPNLDVLTHSLYQLKSHNLFNELSISWAISGHNQKYGNTAFTRTTCDRAWRLVDSDSFDSVNTSGEKAEYDEMSDEFEKIKPFSNESFFRTGSFSAPRRTEPCETDLLLTQ